MTADGHDELHVGRVDIGPLLAIHLDGNKAFVELARNFIILEGFFLEDVAPVAAVEVVG